MNVFTELERLRLRGLTVAIAINLPEPPMVQENDIFGSFVLIGSEANGDGDSMTFDVRQNEGESIEQLLYRAILEFDDTFPEYL